MDEVAEVVVLVVEVELQRKYIVEVELVVEHIVEGSLEDKLEEDVVDLFKCYYRLHNT
jgi:hypothetical protein